MPIIDVIYQDAERREQRISAAIEKEQVSLLYGGDCLPFIRSLPQHPLFDLVVTSPPYNIGKTYEKGMLRSRAEYVAWQEEVIRSLYPLIREHGSICWQMGNYVDHGAIVPLDLDLAAIFERLGMRLRNRIIWTFGHGLHCKKRFSGRYEVILWYTKSDDYVFNLDPVRIPAKYPGKRAYKGPRKGQLTGNPLGKNPSDVWDIPNVKGNHVEKTVHPCQFPVALMERLVLALTNAGGIVFDPFCGVASSGVAALLNGRRYVGCEIVPEYLEIGRQRLEDTESGTVSYRPIEKPLYDPHDSNLSKVPAEWLTNKSEFLK